jgi:quercetin dioxygenase-like cupin family protein
LHTLAAGASVQWPPGEPAPLLLLTEGLGKAQLDGAALRVAAPCALCVPAAAVLRVSNQGSTPMRLLALRPHGHDTSHDAM